MSCMRTTTRLSKLPPTIPFPPLFPLSTKRSRFLNEHPEAGYNLAMNPEFIPAYVFDQGVQLFSRALALHLIPGIPKDIKSTGDVTAILSACRTALQDVSICFAVNN